MCRFDVKYQNKNLFSTKCKSKSFISIDLYMFFFAGGAYPTY